MDVFLQMKPFNFCFILIDDTCKMLLNSNKV